MPYKNKEHKKLNDYLFTQALFKKCVDYLSGKCKLCGETNIHVFCFHHIDKSNKDFTFGGSNMRKSFDKLQVELDKCELLCNNCHKELHFNEPKVHNINSDDIRYKRRKRKNLILEYKNTFKCEKCGYDKCIAALELHHINPNEKELSISKIEVNSIDEVSTLICNELDKCQVLCCNCHQIQHTDLEKYNLYKDKIDEKSKNYKSIKKLTNEDIIKIKDMYNKNTSIMEIANTLGHYAPTIYDAIKRFNL